MKDTVKNYMLNQLKALMDIPSPTGYTDRVQNYVESQLKDMGYKP